jgi:hypothetical protein
MTATELIEQCSNKEQNWFPGRWVGGVSMVLAPLLLLTGVLLRIQFHFFFPQQLAAFKEHPLLITASYNLFLAGTISLWPAIVTLGRFISLKRPGWALCGCTFVIFGLFARTFHAGADYMAFQSTRVQDLNIVTKTVAASYGAFHVVSALNGAILFGWIILAIGAYLSGTCGLVRSIALGLMSALMIGVLKGSSAMSVIAVAGLCLALVPLGIDILTARPNPPIRTVMAWSSAVTALIAAFFVLGQLG